MSLLLLCLFVHLLVADAHFSARVWQSLSAEPAASDFPESGLLRDKPNTAIAFTGGGSRAYVASMGHLAGLHKLDLLKNVRYIGGISGGAWATMTFSYVQNNLNDDVFLGDIPSPRDLTPDDLKNMDPACARGFALLNLTAIALKAYGEKVVDTAAAAWAYGVSKTYLEPAGISPGLYFSWNAATVNDICSRNRQLSASQFVVPRSAQRPFPIIGATVIGPISHAPYRKETQNYTMIEFTPLYVGQLKKQRVEYSAKLMLKETRSVGGAVETFAFAINGSSPLIGMAADHTTALLNVPEPKVKTDVQWAAAASSYAPSSLFASLSPDKLLELSMTVDYWSPSDVIPAAEETLFADGGAYQNIPLISFLQRRVEKIVLFFVSSTPLKPADKWNVYTDAPAADQVSNCLSAFFGVLPPEANWENRSYEYERDQVFAKEDYPVVITALQQAQAKGNGIIATLNLTTIRNDWWGIPAGIQSTITFVYLGRVWQWESQLSDEMQQLLVPQQNASDLSHDVESGPFKHFPHYATKGGDITYEQANALADLTGWVVLQNADVFRSVLQ